MEAELEGIGVPCRPELESNPSESVRSLRPEEAALTSHTRLHSSRSLARIGSDEAPLGTAGHSLCLHISVMTQFHNVAPTRPGKARVALVQGFGVVGNGSGEVSAEFKSVSITGSTLTYEPDAVSQRASASLAMIDNLRMSDF